MHVLKIKAEEIDAIRSDWEKLLQNSQQNNFFLSPDWVLTWWKHFKTIPKYYSYLLAVYNDNNDLIGLAPLMIKECPCLMFFFKLKEIIFMGADDEIGSEYLDIISLKGQENQVNQLIVEYLLEHKNDWDSINLESISANSILAETFRQKLSSNALLYVNTGSECTYLPTTGSWEDYLQTRSGHFRRILRQKFKKVEKTLEGNFITCVSPEEVNQVLQWLFQYNSQRWHNKGKSTILSETIFQQFHQQLAQHLLQQGKLQLDYLKIGDDITSVVYNIKYNNKIYCYNTAFDPNWYKYSVGRLVMAESIRSAFVENMDEFDFLRGNFSYKEEWSSAKRNNINIQVISKSTKALFNYNKNRLIQFLKAKLKTIKIVRSAYSWIKIKTT